MLAQQEFADEFRLRFLQAIPDRRFIGLEGCTTAEKAVHLLRCQALFENALDGLGIVHQTRSFGEQVLELGYDLCKLIGRNDAQGLGRGNDHLQFVLGEKLQQLAGDALAHGKKHRGRLVGLRQRLARKGVTEILEVHHGLSSPSPQGSGFSRTQYFNQFYAEARIVVFQNRYFTARNTAAIHHDLDRLANLAIKRDRCALFEAHQPRNEHSAGAENDLDIDRDVHDHFHVFGQAAAERRLHARNLRGGGKIVHRKVGRSATKGGKVGFGRNLVRASEIAEVAKIGERAFRIRLEDATQIADSLVEVAAVFKRRQRRIIGHRCFLRSHALIIPFETCVSLPRTRKAGQDLTHQMS
ncbi:hypothetical protein D3C72_591870 [compost metagenome]